MKTIIEAINFEPGVKLSNFIMEKSQSFFKIDKHAVFAEFGLEVKKGVCVCSIVLVLGGKNVTVTRQAEDMQTAAADAIADISNYLKRNKSQQKLANKKRQVELKTYYEIDDGIFGFSAN